jgi:hypothetical protein
MMNLFAPSPPEAADITTRQVLAANPKSMDAVSDLETDDLSTTDVVDDPEASDPETDDLETIDAVDDPEASDPETIDAVDDPVGGDRETDDRETDDDPVTIARYTTGEYRVADVANKVHEHDMRLTKLEIRDGSCQTRARAEVDGAGVDGAEVDGAEVDGAEVDGAEVVGADFGIEPGDVGRDGGHDGRDGNGGTSGEIVIGGTVLIM